MSEGLRERLAEAIERVRQLHRRNNGFPYYCTNCRSPYPCRTILALADTLNPKETQP